jgi:hypothetical protein
LFCLLPWLLLAVPVSAQPLRISDVRIGFPYGARDFHRPGCWVPVAVEFVAEPNTKETRESLPAYFQGQLIVETTDSEGAQTRFTVPQVTVRKDELLKTGKAGPFLAYTKLGSANSEVRISFRLEQSNDGKGNTTKTSGTLTFNYPEDRRANVPGNFYPATATNSDHRFVLALGNVSRLPVPQQRQDEDRCRYQITQITDPSYLPTQWFGYEGVDVVILGTGTTWQGSMAQTVLNTPSLREPLFHWVAQGGHLVVGVGNNADKLADKNSNPFAAAKGLFPAEIDPTRTQANATLEELRRKIDERTNRERSTSIRPLTANTIVSLKPIPPAREWASYQGSPLVVHGPFGLGRVTLIAFDIDTGNFVNWDNGGEFWQALLSLQRSAEPNYGNVYDPSNDPGIKAASDFTRALEQFGEMPVVSFFLVAVFILGYIILIGPVDYFFLKKVVKRLEWTWITFPTLVLVVSVGAYLAAYYIKGDEMRLNKVDLVDVDLAHERIMGNSWLTVFSPNLQKYDLQLMPVVPGGEGQVDGKPCMSWQGQPGYGPRSFDRQQSASLFRRDYAFGPDAASLEGVPIQVWGMKTFTSRWQAKLPEGQLLTAKFALNDQLALTGEIKSGLSVPLTDCRLIYQDQFWELGTLEPNGTLRVTVSGAPLNSQHGFRVLQAAELKVNNKALADYTGPLAELMYPRLTATDRSRGSRDELNRAPHYMDYLDQTWRLNLNLNEAVFLATVENRHGNAPTLNDEVKLGTKLSTFKPALRGSLRQATYLRVFVPVERQKK